MLSMFRYPLPFTSLFFALSAQAVLSTAAFGLTEKATVTYVYDGDTLKVTIGGRSEVVRLIGVDAPENHDNERLRQQALSASVSVKGMLDFGDRSARAVRDLAPQGTIVELEYDATKHDKFNRLLAYVYLPDKSMLNKRILELGYAKLLIVPPNTRHLMDLSEAAARGKSAKRGLWSMRGFD